MPNVLPSNPSVPAPVVSQSQSPSTVSHPQSQPPQIQESYISPTNNHAIDANQRLSLMEAPVRARALTTASDVLPTLAPPSSASPPHFAMNAASVRDNPLAHTSIRTISVVGADTSGNRHLMDQNQTQSHQNHNHDHHPHPHPHASSSGGASSSPVVEGFRNASPPTIMPLVQIRPDPHPGVGQFHPLPYPWRRLRRNPVTALPSKTSGSKERHGKSSIYRWLTFYLPILVVVGFLLYILSELFMKHLALRTIQQHLAALPEVPTTLPSAPPMGLSKLPGPSAAAVLPTSSPVTAATNTRPVATLPGVTQTGAFNRAVLRPSSSAGTLHSYVLLRRGPNQLRQSPRLVPAV